MKKDIRLSGDQEVDKNRPRVEIRTSGDQREKIKLINLIFCYPDVPVYRQALNRAGTGQAGTT